MAAPHEDDAPETFRRACESLRAVRLRPEVVLDEAPAPQRLAPWAVAMTGDVLADPNDDASEELGTGRFVLLHDPAGHETWNGTFRVVTFVRAAVEPEVAADPMLPSVGWSWLVEALEEHHAPYTAPSGTVTRVASESFGAMGDRDPDGRGRDPGLVDRAGLPARPAPGGLGRPARDDRRPAAARAGRRRDPAGPPHPLNRSRSALGRPPDCSLLPLQFTRSAADAGEDNSPPAIEQEDG